MDPVIFWEVMQKGRREGTQPWGGESGVSGDEDRGRLRVSERLLFVGWGWDWDN